MSLARIVLLLIVPVLATGCLVVPTKRTTTRVVETGGVEIQSGPLGRRVLDADPTSGTVILSSYRPRECTRARYDLHETRTETVAELDSIGGGGGNDLYGLIGLVMLAPATLVVSGVITAIVVRATDDVTTETREYSEARRYRCPLLDQGLAIEIVLPSGATAVAVTNAYGRVFFSVPSTEPDRGLVTARAPGGVTRAIAYDRALP